jgi:hypothetical protein
MRPGPAVPPTHTAGSRRQKPREQTCFFTDFPPFIPIPWLGHREHARGHWEASLSLYKDGSIQGRAYIIHSRHGKALPLRHLHSRPMNISTINTTQEEKGLGSWSPPYWSASSMSSSSTMSPSLISFVYLVVIQTLVWIWSYIQLYHHIWFIPLWCWLPSYVSSFLCSWGDGGTLA